MSDNQSHNDDKTQIKGIKKTAEVVEIVTQPYDFPDRRPLEKALAQISSGSRMDPKDHQAILKNEELSVEYAAELLEAGKPIGEDLWAVLLSSSRNSLDFARACRARDVEVRGDIIEKIKTNKCHKASWEVHEKMRVNPEKVLRDWMNRTGLKRRIWIDGEIGRQGVQIIMHLGGRLAYFSVADDVEPGLGLSEAGEIYEILDDDGDNILGNLLGTCSDAEGFDTVVRKEGGWGDDLPPLRPKAANQS